MDSNFVLAENAVPGNKKFIIIYREKGVRSIQSCHFLADSREHALFLFKLGKEGALVMACHEIDTEEESVADQLE